MAPRISVCITSYNQKPYLSEAIDSALDQTLPAFQIIIVDDCSTDGSRDVIADYQSRYPAQLVPVYHGQNSGVAQSRVSAAEAASGDLMTYLDGDDRFLPTKLEKESEALKCTAQAQIAFSDFYYIDEHGARICAWAGDDAIPDGDVFRQTFARDFPRRTLFRSELVRRESWRLIGFHDTRLCLYEDYDMRIRLTSQFRSVYTKQPLSEYRLHGRGLSRTRASRHYEALRYVYRKNLPLLSELSCVDRAYAKRGAGRFIAEVAIQAAREALDQNQRFEAVRLLAAAGRYDADKRSWGALLRVFGPRSAL